MAFDKIFKRALSADLQIESTQNWRTQDRTDTRTVRVVLKTRLIPHDELKPVSQGSIFTEFYDVCRHLVAKYWWLEDAGSAVTSAYLRPRHRVSKFHWIVRTYKSWRWRQQIPSKCCCQTARRHIPKDRRLNTGDVFCRSENRMVKSSLPPGQHQQQKGAVSYVANKSGEAPRSVGLLHNRQRRDE